MKRTKSIRLILIGGLSAGALSGCSPNNGGKPPISADNVYTNNFAVPGVGYYHAPFRAWYSLPYNHYEPRTQRFFYGGRWGDTPFESITNISSPTPVAASQAEATRVDIVRGGFGSTSGGFFHGGFHGGFG